MNINTVGATRTVILTEKYAFKLPGTWGERPSYWWKHLLLGLLANIQEITFSKTKWPELCPILFYIPGGFLVVMPRLQIMTKEEFKNFDWNGFQSGQDYTVPVENKADSFGYLNGKVVAVDYGI